MSSGFRRCCPSAGRSCRSAGLLIGAGRVGLGGAFLAFPDRSTKILGLDAATAGRVTWLARMTAIRDVALGAGTILSAAGGRGAASWLLAGAACDAVDAGALATAVRQQRLPAVRAGVMAGLAGATSAAGVAVALRAREK
jgi:hypothetical protein